MSAALTADFDVITDTTLFCKTAQDYVKQDHHRVLLIGGCGYIGSYLYPELRGAGYDVDVADHLARGLGSGPVPLFTHSHTNISNSLIRDYDTVLWFAGKYEASAGKDILLAENCLLLTALRRRMRKGARLIYASDACLYAINHGEPVWSDESGEINAGQNAYTASKAAMDAITSGFLDNTVALRLGNVAGWSPNLRTDLIFNRMCLDALETRSVAIPNPMAWTSVLFLQDLSSVVLSLIKAEDPPRILNVASLSATHENLGHHIARHFRAETVSGYSSWGGYRMRTTRMLEMLSYNPSSVRIPDHCQMFAASINKSKGTVQ